MYPYNHVAASQMGLLVKEPEPDFSFVKWKFHIPLYRTPSIIAQFWSILINDDQNYRIDPNVDQFQSFIKIERNFR